MWSVSNVCHGKESKEWRHMCHIFAIFGQDDFKALSRSKAQVLLFDTQSDDTIGCPLNTCENPIFQLVLNILLLHMMSSNRYTREYIQREKQNKMTCPKVSCKFPIFYFPHCHLYMRLRNYFYFVHPQPVCHTFSLMWVLHPGLWKNRTGKNHRCYVMCVCETASMLAHSRLFRGFTRKIYLKAYNPKNDVSHKNYYCFWLTDNRFSFSTLFWLLGNRMKFIAPL